MRDAKLTARAAEIHNSQEFEFRKICSISSMQTQITTLERMKINIREDAEKRCNEINAWIKNIEESLRRDIAEYDRASKSNPAPAGV